MIDRDYLSSVAAILLGQPIYAVFLSDGVPDRVRFPHAMAFTGRTLDLSLHPLLESLQRWNGRRPAIVFDDAMIAEHATRYVARFGGDVTSTARELANSMLIHELAHVAEKGIDTSAPTPALEKAAMATAAFSIAIAESKSEAKTLAVFGTGHGPTFARLACHVYYRAMQVGCGCPIDWVFDGEQYGLPTAEECDSALVNEPASLAYRSLFEISKIRLPLPFKKMFEPVGKASATRNREDC